MNYKIFNSAIMKAIDGDYFARIDEFELEPEYRPIGSALNILIENFEEKDKAKKSGKAESGLSISNNPIPILLFDKNFNVVEANPAFFDISGYKKEQLYSMNAGNFSLDMIEGDHFKKTLETKKGGYGKFKAEVPSGEKIVERHLLPYLDEKGHISGYFGIYLDITEYERNRERIRELESVNRYYEDEINRISDNLSLIADGNSGINLDILSPDIHTKAVYDKALTVNEKFRNVIDSVGSMIEEAEMLTRAGAEGRLNERADVSRHRGDFAGVIEGLNSTLDAMAAPVNELIPVLDNLSVNDYTVKMTGSYSGDFAGVAESVNSLVDHLIYIQETVTEIGDGNLKRLEAYRKIGRRSDNDNMIPAFVHMMEALKAVIDEAEFLSRAVAEGKLTTKANLERHKGDYYNIVYGFVNALRNMLAPLNEARVMADHFSKGDYSVRFSDGITVAGDFLTFKDELNEVAFNTSAMVKEIKKNSESVKNGTDEISKASVEIIGAVEQVALKCQKSADNTRQLLRQIENVSEQISNLSSSNEEIANTSQEILSAATDVSKRGQEAQVLGNETNEKMNAVKMITEASVGEIETLNENIYEINNVVKVITGITNQINLLSLNAAIEAARAGEHGRGFAVVAGEVKNLANEAKNATAHIEKVISTIQKSSAKTVDSIKSANAEVGSGVESVNRVISSLNIIVNETNAATEAIGDITKALESQAEIAGNVVHAADEGAKLTRSTQSDIDELAALSEESSASIEEIGSAIQEVNEVAENLKESMEVFKTQ